jgi:hypothetical protein
MDNRNVKIILRGLLIVGIVLFAINAFLINGLLKDKTEPVPHQQDWHERATETIDTE